MLLRAVGHHEDGRGRIADVVVHGLLERGRGGEEGHLHPGGVVVARWKALGQLVGVHLEPGNHARGVGGLVEALVGVRFSRRETATVLRRRCCGGERLFGQGRGRMRGRFKRPHVLQQLGRGDAGGRRRRTLNLQMSNRLLMLLMLLLKLLQLRIEHFYTLIKGGFADDIRVEVGLDALDLGELADQLGEWH